MATSFRKKLDCNKWILPTIGLLLYECGYADHTYNRTNMHDSSKVAKWRKNILILFHVKAHGLCCFLLHYSYPSDILVRFPQACCNCFTWSMFTSLAIKGYQTLKHFSFAIYVSDRSVLFVIVMLLPFPTIKIRQNPPKCEATRKLTGREHHIHTI